MAGTATHGGRLRARRGQVGYGCRVGHGHGIIGEPCARVSASVMRWSLYDVAEYYAVSPCECYGCASAGRASSTGLRARHRSRRCSARHRLVRGDFRLDVCVRACPCSLPRTRSRARSCVHRLGFSAEERCESNEIRGALDFVTSAEAGCTCRVVSPVKASTVTGAVEVPSSSTRRYDCHLGRDIAGGPRPVHWLVCGIFPGTQIVQYSCVYSWGSLENIVYAPWAGARTSYMGVRVKREQRRQQRALDPTRLGDGLASVAWQYFD